MSFGNGGMDPQEQARYEREASMQRATLGRALGHTSAGTIRGLAESAPKESATARELASLQKMAQVLADGVRELEGRMASVLRITAPAQSDEAAMPPSTGVPLADGISQVNGDLYRVGRHLRSLMDRIDL